jgi:hypothetical protein
MRLDRKQFTLTNSGSSDDGILAQKCAALLAIATSTNKRKIQGKERPA